MFHFFSFFCSFLFYPRSSRVGFVPVEWCREKALWLDHTSSTLPPPRFVRYITRSTQVLILHYQTWRGWILHHVVCVSGNVFLHTIGTIISWDSCKLQGRAVSFDTQFLYPETPHSALFRHCVNSTGHVGYAEKLRWLANLLGKDSVWNGKQLPQFLTSLLPQYR